MGSVDPLAFMRETRLKNSRERRELLIEWLRRVYAQYDLETDEARKMRLESGIYEKEAELEKIEQELREL